MAYFDDPENMKAWQEELKILRAEREKRTGINSDNNSDNKKMEK